MSIIKKDGFDFSFEASVCDACEGNCCIGESGYIWINQSEIKVLAKHLNLDVEELVFKHLRKIGYKYSIKELQIAKDNYSCMFFDLEKKQCSVYEARPRQCKTFPFWDYFKTNIEEVKNECPAIQEL